jgi:uncharacterized protein (DUF2235 family)
MSKNIVICCDGTGNQFGRDGNSNVVKLYRTLDLTDPGRQVAYYHPGLGTLGAPAALTAFTAFWTKIAGLLFAFGIMDDIGDAYSFLMNTYEPGDRIFLFGFSRGAYTARALAAMLHIYGLIRSGDSVLIRYACRLFRKRTGDDKTKVAEKLEIGARFKKTFSRICPVHFVGVWDTVSSVGWWHSVSLPYTAKNPDVTTLRHAVSIDERRCYFWQNMWNEKEKPASQDVKQVWFPGVHSDVGGSYPEKDSGLSKSALAWMLDEAEKVGLLVDQSTKAHILGATGGGYVPPSATAPIHESLRGFWWLAEILPRRRYDVVTGRRRWIIPFARSREIPTDALLDVSVAARLRVGCGYAPKNLP